MSAHAQQWVWDILKGELGDVDISTTQSFVLLALANFANEKDKLWYSYAAIAKQTKMNRRTVMNACQWLEENRFIHIERRKLTGDKNDSNMFTLLIPGKKYVSKRGTINSELNSPQEDLMVNEVHQDSESDSLKPNIEPNKYLYIYKGHQRKDDFEVEIPDGLTHEQVDQFVQHRADLKRADKKKKLTKRVVQLGITKMLELVQQGEDLDTCLNTMEMKGWDQPWPERKEKPRHENTARTTRKQTVYDKLADAHRRIDERYGTGRDETQDDGCIIEGEFFPC